METDKTIYPEYTKDNEIHDLKNIISSLETKIEKLEKQFAISGVVGQSEQLEAAWKALEWVGFTRGEEFDDDDIKELLGF